ncbi:MAG: phosphate acyltransferase PlsX [Clostridia bacterium]|nr:phosphate acyltransferase PlsX [Clostridia bacterium]
MEILVDVNGSDNGISEAIKAVIAVKSKIKSKILLVGDKENIITFVKEEYLDKADNIIKELNILDAKDVITNYDDPAFAIKHKKESSIVKAYDYMKETEDTLFLSAGSTGAVMAGGLLKLKRIEGIRRPALVSILPTTKGNGVVMLDCGANTSAADISMVQFAKMGIIYAKEILKKDAVKVGLLNIGTESKKGSPDLKETYESLEAECPEFAGNIEAREILSGDFDVVVANGLMGNVALKAIEGTAKTMKNALTSEFKKNVLNKLAAVTSIGVIKKALLKYDYTQYGGAVLLGVRKPVVKIHGNAKQKNYEVAIMQGDSILKKKIVDKVKKSIEENV